MSDLKTVNIKGKEYVEVNERIRHFRTAEEYKDWALLSEMVSLENGVVTFKASVLNENDRVIATGYAQEKEGSTFINKTSFIENCETSAWGRALGNLGIGVDTSIASKEEVENAMANQKKETKSLGNVTEEEAYEKARKDLLMKINDGLDKEENAPYKAQVFEEMAKRYGVNGFMLIKPKKGGKAFMNEVQELLEEIKSKQGDKQ